jgi:flagellar biosynthesis protein FliQ
MFGILTKISTRTIFYIIILIVSLVAFILLEKWPGARTLMQQLDKGLGIGNLNWPILLVSLIVGFLSALSICNNSEN